MCFRIEAGLSLSVLKQWRLIQCQHISVNAFGGDVSGWMQLLFSDANERMLEAQARSYCNSNVAVLLLSAPPTVWRNGTAVNVLLCYVQTVTSCIRLCIISLPTMLHGQLHFQIALLIRLVLQPDLLAVLARSINFCMSMWKLLCVHCKVTKNNFTFSGPCITIYLLNKVHQQGALFFLNLFDSSILYMVQLD